MTDVNWTDEQTYGDNVYLIRMDDGSDLVVLADDVAIANGDLYVMGHTALDKKPQVLMVFPFGQWRYVYLTDRNFEPLSVIQWERNNE